MDNTGVFIEGDEHLENVYQSIVQHTVAYIARHKIKSLVLGLSGGIDSTLTAALAFEVCREFHGEVKLLGRFLPINHNQQFDIVHSINNGIEIASHAGATFCHDFRIKDLTGPYTAMKACLMDEFDILVYGLSSIYRRSGNIQARCRMIYLFDCAAKNNGMVLSTDNYTEWLLGFWTLHGDVGNYGMIQNLWKSEVYALTAYLARCRYQNSPEKQNVLNQSIKATPTDGLGLTESDFQQICPDIYDQRQVVRATPWDTYRRVDKRLQTRSKSKDNETVRLYEQTMFKRSDPYNIPRSVLIKKR